MLKEVVVACFHVHIQHLHGLTIATNISETSGSLSSDSKVNPRKTKTNE